MQDADHEICREDREECVEALFRLEVQGRKPSLADLVAEPDLSERPVTDIVMELALDDQVKVQNDAVVLTPKGRAIGKRIYERHELAEKLMRSLGLRGASAHEEACRVEHLVDDGAIEAAVRRLDRFEAMLDSGVLRLSDADRGEYRIVFLSTGRFRKRRLEDMGLGQGAVVWIDRRRSRGPVMVEAHGAKLALGRGIATRILVVPVAQCDTGPDSGPAGSSLGTGTGTGSGASSGRGSVPAPTS